MKRSRSTVEICSEYDHDKTTIVPRARPRTFLQAPVVPPCFPLAPSTCCRPCDTCENLFLTNSHEQAGLRGGAGRRAGGGVSAGRDREITAFACAFAVSRGGQIDASRLREQIHFTKATAGTGTVKPAFEPFPSQVTSIQVPRRPNSLIMELRRRDSTHTKAR